MRLSLSSKVKAFTLVELMVGIVLSLIVLGATITVYLSSKQTNTLNQGIINIQNDGQLAVQVLKDNIRNAGWARPESLSYTLGSPIVRDQSADAGAEGSDTLAVQFEGDFDCNGIAVTTDPVINVFTVTNGNLTCNGQPIISNVDSFQVQYAVDNGNGLELVTIDNVADVSKIRSIRMAFSISSDDPVPNGNPSRTIQLLDVQLPEFTDQRARQVYDLTVAVLNTPRVDIQGVIYANFKCK